MIRLPPSSISLSENDLAFHLDQMDIYHGLLKQGFTKHEIIRYMNEHQAAQQPPLPREPAADTDPGPRPLSTVQLAAIGPIHAKGTLAFTNPITTIHRADQADEEACQSPEQQHGQGEAIETASDLTPRAIESNSQVVRHAPRQSSLLRFAEAASPSSSEQKELHAGTGGQPPRSSRVRTDTTSSSPSEKAEHDIANALLDLHLTSQDSARGNHHSKSSPDAGWAEAEAFVPGRQRRLPSTEHLPPSDGNWHATGNNEHSIDPGHLTKTATPRLVSWNEARRATTSDSAGREHSSNLSSSPLGIPTARNDPPGRQLVSSPTLPAMPVTPTPLRTLDRTARTEPRQHRHLHHAEFDVYDDSLPQTDQPQTPADLSRHSILTERDAAYTAPPGSPVRRSRAAMLDATLDGDAQHTFAHAVGSRERRARELARSARAEGARLQRIRQQDRDRTARGFDGNDETRDRNDGPGPAITAEWWRDEFEGDRVGEENWEGDNQWTATPANENGIRTISGNARNGWINDLR